MFADKVNNMRAHIIYFNFLKPDGEGFSLGGIQTYILNLIPVLRECGYEVTVYQRSQISFHKDFDGYDVYGLKNLKEPGVEVATALLDFTLSHVNVKDDLILYGCESCITRKVDCKTIAIQHGISWDVQSEKCSGLRYMRKFLGKYYTTWKTVRRVEKADQLICVDYNFVNWYRAVTPYVRTNLVTIPNFTAIPQEMPQKDSDVINIIFARRFFPHRGTRLFTDVVERLLDKWPVVRITIAGDGPDASYMHGKLDKFSNVSFISYESKDSMKIHADKHIAVVPTLGSEGTSLSLLEAMASGCAVVCTNVGGMTNIVLDGYNGLCVEPSEQPLYDALDKLVADTEYRAMIQRYAYDTVSKSFSRDKWRNNWKRVLMS